MTTRLCHCGTWALTVDHPSVRDEGWFHSPYTCHRVEQ